MTLGFILRKLFLLFGLHTIDLFTLMTSVHPTPPPSSSVFQRSVEWDGRGLRLSDPVDSLLLLRWSAILELVGVTHIHRADRDCTISVLTF